MINVKKVLLKPSNIILLVCLILFTAFAPHFFTGYTFNVVNVALIYVLCVYGASILIGMGGQVSFASITFMAFGAYYTAILGTNRLGLSLSPIMILITAPIVVGLIGLVLGLVLFRLKGIFFVFGTLGLVNIAVIFFGNHVPLFGGPTGIPNIPKLNIGDFRFDTNPKWLYLLIATTVIGYIIVERIRNTKLGRSLASIKDNETAALSLGVNVYMTKVYSFSISSVFCGLAGVLYAMQSGFISSDLFSAGNATLIIIMLIMGGMNHTLGAIIGAIIVSVLPETFRDLKSFLQLAYGLVIILLMVFMPTGIAGLGEKIAEQIKKIVCLKKKMEQSGEVGKHAAGNND